VRCSERGTKFYFKDGFRSQTESRLSGHPSRFDQVLLDHAAECGAEVHEETSVDRVEFSKEDVELAIRRNSSSHSIRARYVIDASGRTSVARQTVQD